MKAKAIFSRFLLIPIVLGTMLYSCGDSSSDNPPSEPDPSTKSISITGSALDIDLKEGETTCFFTVTTDNGKNITSSSKIFVNDQAIKNSFYTPKEVGAYSVYAEYENLKSNSITLNAKNTTLTLTSDKSRVKKGEKVTFTVKDYADVDITAESEIKVNKVAIGGNTYISTTDNVLSVAATYKGSTSNILIINGFKHKVLIEDFTGTWCGWCPRVLWALELLKRETENIVVVAVHNSDPMANEASSGLEAFSNISAFPTAIINRDLIWPPPEDKTINNVLEVLKETSEIGIAINSSLTTSSGTVSAKIKLEGESKNKSLRYIVYILEDGFKATQENYTDHYDRKAQLVDLEHEHILIAISEYKGVTIPSDQISENNEFSFTMSFNYKSLTKDLNNLSIVVAIADNENVLNVHSAPANTDQGYNH